MSARRFLLTFVTSTGQAVRMYVQSADIAAVVFTAIVENGWRLHSAEAA